SSASSLTTTPAVSTASGGPSRVSTLPRRNTSQSRWPSNARSTASPLPASSLATTLSSSSCLRTRRLERLAHLRRDPLAVRSAVHPRHHRLHDEPHVPGAGGARFGDRLADQRVELGVPELGGQVALDQLGLGLFLLGQLCPAGLAVLLGRFQPALALPAQDR